jgi:CRP-like cAMP-binding protein
VTLGVRGPGSWFGEVGFVDAGPSTATVVARGPVSTLRIDHATLMRLSTDHPEVASALLRHVNRQMALRIAESSSGIMDHVGPGRYRLRKPDEVRSWTSRALSWLLGAQERP